MTTKDAVSAREAARMIDRNERTIRRWIVQDKGKPNPRLPGAYQDQDGIFRVPVHALKPYLPDALEAPNGQGGAHTGEATIADLTGFATSANAVLAAVSPNWMERAIRAETRLDLLYQLTRAARWDAVHAVLEAAAD
jgi:hypothetical protein